MQPLQGALIEQYGFEHCPDNPAAAIKECGDSVGYCKIIFFKNFLFIKHII